MRHKSLPEIGREELEAYVRGYLQSGGKIQKLKPFEPADKLKAFQQGHFHDVENDTVADIGFTELPVDGK